MFTEEEIIQILNDKIIEDEKLGQKAGGSGHSGFVYFDILSHEACPLPGNLWQINYQYKLIVETEFTYYPDNPPMEYSREKSIVINVDKRIIGKPKPNCNK